MISSAAVAKSTITQISRKVKDAKTIAISGHTNPDGDCVGACLGLYTYIRNQYPGKQVDILLEPISRKFHFLNYAENIKQEKDLNGAYDLYSSLDCSDTERLSSFRGIFAEANYTICIDHHVSNTGFGDLNCVVPEASSTCEILYDIFDEKRISFDCAQCLYLGLVHDTGVFKHSNTTRHVMEIAGVLIEKGVRPDFIIDETFYKKTYLQNQILGRALMESILLMDGRIIFSVLRNKDVVTYGIKSEDLDGVIDQLRVTEGVECALLLYEREEGVFKVSMRSNGRVNVSKIAQEFGGGGHVKAAGYTAVGDARDIINNVSLLVESQLEQ